MGMLEKVLKKIRDFIDEALLKSDSDLEENSEELDEEDDINDDDTKICVSKKTWIQRLSDVSVSVEDLKFSFPSQYKRFNDKIEDIKKIYFSNLEYYEKDLHFEVNPEESINIITEISRLESEVTNFMEFDVKFELISKRLEELITKLNILYNSSIFHFSNKEKQKILSRIDSALTVENKILEEFKENKKILQDQCSKERIINLLAYTDYEILKLLVRNGNQLPETIIKDLAVTKFDGFNYLSTFVVFAKDEISDLAGILPLVKDVECRKDLRKTISQIRVDMMNYDNAINLLLNQNFWNKFIMLETNLLGALKISGVEKDKIKVQLINRMSIKLKEDDVIDSPKVDTCMALTNLYIATQDDKILVLLELVKNLSDEVTYREIYFLLLLFDVLDVIENTPNDLIKSIGKYIKKYPYNKNEIEEKKKRAKATSNKEYLVAFSMDSHREQAFEALKQLNIDFKIENNNVLINSLYFYKLENILNSLRNNTSNITTI